VAARVKADLLREFNLHTIIRLPEGVFAPYTDIPTNIIFFDTTGPTQEICYWQQPMAEGRRKYSKTAPLQFEELADCVAWCGARGDDARAWRVQAEGQISTDADGRVLAVNLDVKNPNEQEAEEHRAPIDILRGIVAREMQVLELLREIEALTTERT
jgi:type I restriction enzyme M protein